MKKLLNNKSALLLWGARSFSRFGDSLEMLALLYLVYDLTGSGLAMGSLMLFSVLPNAIISPFAGVLADKYDKKKIMFLGEMVRGIAIAIIPILMITETIHLWHIYLISVLVSIAESFFEPAAGTTFVLVVGREDMPLFNSVVTISNHIMRVLGFSLSGIIMATIGKEIIFVVDAVTFLASGVIALMVKIPDMKKEKSEEVSDFKKELLSGFTYVLENKVIMSIIVVIIFIQFFQTPLDTYIPLIIEKVLLVPTVWSGYFATATIIGAIIGNVLYPFLNKTSMKLYHLYLYGIAILGVSIGLCGFILTPIYYVLMFFVLGVVGSLISTWSFTEIQLLVDTNYLGRVSSILIMISLISTPLAGVVFGGLADVIYIPQILKGLGAIWLVVSLLSSFLIRKNSKHSIKVKNFEY